ncbi:hypothetical protein B0H14DRAFT_3507848 [Mycena olivaceomarginata]|nr:hypothetical protein B0H14DRAFT_3507848 [Mycena olivaceomarginata]
MKVVRRLGSIEDPAEEPYSDGDRLPGRDKRLKGKTNGLHPLPESPHSTHSQYAPSSIQQPHPRLHLHLRLRLRLPYALAPTLSPPPPARKKRGSSYASPRPFTYDSPVRLPLLSVLALPPLPVLLLPVSVLLLVGPLVPRAGAGDGAGAGAGDGNWRGEGNLSTPQEGGGSEKAENYTLSSVGVAAEDKDDSASAEGRRRPSLASTPATKQDEHFFVASFPPMLSILGMPFDVMLDFAAGRRSTATRSH